MLTNIIIALCLFLYLRNIVPHFPHIMMIFNQGFYGFTRKLAQPVFHIYR